MKNFTILLLVISILLISCDTKDQNTTKNSINYLKEGFQTPPLEARPRALWDWVDGNFSLDEITNEMEEAVAKGMGGFDIWDVRNVRDEHNIVPAGPAFMGDESLDGIIHAINEAERLKLDLGLIVASGWNAGGPWTKPENQMMGLFSSTKTVKGGQQVAVQLEFPKIIEEEGNSGGVSASFIQKSEDGLPKYYREVRVVAIPVSKDSSVIRKNDIIDISDKMDEKGSLKWDAPKGDWKISRYVCTNTGQGMISSSPNSKGPMIDHFNPEATVDHINFFLDKLEGKLGKSVGESGLSYLYTDSYEVLGMLWTEKLFDVFEEQMGYSMIPFISVFDGYTVENKEITDRFLYDYKKVWSDLIINSHYKKATEICESHGIGFVAEAAGPGMPIHNCPFESLKSSGALSFPRGEFWHLPNKKYVWEDFREKNSKRFLDDLQVIKGVASASHIYNQKYVEAEAFTGIHLYTEGPGDLKPTADRAFAEGLNRIIFHTWPHTPKEAGTPGWSYSFGTLMHENRVWWPKSKPWMEYLGRTSFMLQQGNFVGDIMYYYGDEAPNFVPVRKYDPSRGYGFDYDFCNSEILLDKIAVKNGDLTLPHGQTYEILVLPDNDYMTLEILEKIESLVVQGATVVGRKPVKSHGLKDWKKNDVAVQKLADKLWGNCDGVAITENNYGKGKIVWGKTPKEVLKNKNVAFDFDFNGSVENTKLNFIHRTSDGSEIYFVTNTLDQEIFGDATFRVSGKQPQIWNPVTGTMNDALVFDDSNGKTTISLHLESYGSTFIVFSETEQKEHFVKVSRDNQQIFPTTGNYKTPGFFQTDTKNLQLVFNAQGVYKLETSTNTTTKFEVGENRAPISLTGSWQVHFPKEKKGVGTVEFEKLESWTASKIFDIQFFSGIATYEKSFTIPEDVNLDALNSILDLGAVKELAHVFINGKDAGISWAKPNRVSISEFVKPGNNTLKIEVANTWHNRLCGDAKLPLTDRVSKTNIARLPNTWLFPMEEIPVTNEYELLDSGLLGPVKIEFTAKLELE